jgi:hypothetical protein
VDRTARPVSADSCAAEALALLAERRAERALAHGELAALQDGSLPRVRHLGASFRVAGVYRELATRTEQLNVRL